MNDLIQLSGPMSPQAPALDEAKDAEIPEAYLKFKPKSVAETQELPTRTYMIDELVAPGELSVWYGSPGASKTFLLLETGRCLAMGVDWFGRRTKAGPILYVLAEGSSGTRQRIAAMKKVHGLKDDDPFHTITVAPDLLSDDDTNAIIFWAEYYGAALIVMDTLSRTMIGDDNSSVDMPKYIRACDRIRQETGAHVAVVHHAGKDSNKGSRGHSSLKGATDVEVLVEEQNDAFTATVKKNKDGPENWHVGYRLEVVEVDTNEHGEPITSCAVIPAEVSKKAKKERISGHPARLLDALHEVLIKEGKIMRGVDGIPDGAKCAPLDSLRKEFYARTPDSNDEQDKALDAKRRAFGRSLEKLEHRIGHRDGKVWDIKHLSGPDGT
jgi:hypothetical protein